MNGDEMSRGMNQQNRKPSLPKHSYSPSSNYGYNYSNGYNSGNNSGYNGQQQNQRRRPDHRFKSGSNGHHTNYSERLVKQNDIIINLLKEIRDRLPAPPVDSTNVADQEYFEQDREGQVDQINDQADQEAMDDSEDMEPGDNQKFTSDQEQDSFQDDERN